MRQFYIILLFYLTTVGAVAQDELYKHHRSSMYSILLKHDGQPFNEEIVEAFQTIPIPDKFDEFNLTKRIFNASVLQKTKDENWDDQKTYIDEFLGKNAIARRLVAKWYNQTKTGCFDCNLLIEKGLYNASSFEIDLADKTIRGRSGAIRDAGTELISNTYVIVHDIQHDITHTTGNVLGGTISFLSGAAIIIPVVGNLVSQVGDIAGQKIKENYQKFNVSVTSYLYRLVWNEEMESIFYENYYTTIPDNDKKNRFSKDKSSFYLEYVGKQTVWGTSTSMKGVNKQEEYFIKACTRAIDKSIAQLQKDHEEFRIKTPLLSTDPLTAKIGLKEDIDPDSKFEVLEVSTENDTTKYKRVGIIKPIKGKIWDNRYMAEYEEKSHEAFLNSTEFETVSGSDFYPGMLIREISK